MESARSFTPKSAAPPESAVVGRSVGMATMGVEPGGAGEPGETCGGRGTVGDGAWRLGRAGRDVLILVQNNLD